MLAKRLNIKVKNQIKYVEGSSRDRLIEADYANKSAEMAKLLRYTRFALPTVLFELSEISFVQDLTDEPDKQKCIGDGVAFFRKLAEDIRGIVISAIANNLTICTEYYVHIIYKCQIIGDRIMSISRHIVFEFYNTGLIDDTINFATAIDKVHLLRFYIFRRFINVTEFDFALEDRQIVYKSSTKILTRYI